MMFTKITKPFVVFCLFGCAVVNCAITMPPLNTVVVSGNMATLNCTSSSSSRAIYWYISPTGTPIYIVENCAVATAYVTQYRVDDSVSGQCNLIIQTASSASALAYSCQDSQRPSAAFLTVLASTPSCGTDVATNPIPENTTITSSCNVSYISPIGGPTVTMTWSGECAESPVTYNTTFFSSSVQVIARRPTVQSCYCTTRFTAPPQQPDVATNAPSFSYSWSSPSNIPVSYCPTVSLSPTQDTGFQNTTVLSCSSVAYPSVTTSDYTWTTITGSGEANGQTFRVTSVGNYNIRCTATNYLLGGTNGRCSNSVTATGTTVASSVATVTTTPSYTTVLWTMATNDPSDSNGTATPSTEGPSSYSSSNNTAAIVLGILFGVSILVNIAFIVFIIHHRRTALNQSSERNLQQRQPDPPNYTSIDITTRDLNQNKPAIYEVLSVDRSANTPATYYNVK